ncbi:MAG: FCD domain-containing protein [Corynebacterium sp.]|nr:FCD domain-containing protein [Corynebacterium sp.]
MSGSKSVVDRNSTVQAIANYIRDHQLNAGDALPSEAALCELLNVSRSSVREAIRTLASLDIVETRHGHGSYVGKMSLAPLVNGLVLRMTLHEGQALENLSHVVAMRETLDLANAAELTAKLKGQDLRELEDVVAEMRDLHAAGESFAIPDYQFHYLLSTYVSNPLMQEFSLALWEIHTSVVPALGLGAPEDMEDTVRAHALMLDALKAGDEQRYRELITEHYAPLRNVIAAKRAGEPDD